MLYKGLPNSQIAYPGWLLDLYEFWLNTLTLFEIFVKSQQHENPLAVQRTVLPWR